MNDAEWREGEVLGKLAFRRRGVLQGKKAAAAAATSLLAVLQRLPNHGEASQGLSCGRRRVRPRHRPLRWRSRPKQGQAIRPLLFPRLFAAPAHCIPALVTWFPPLRFSHGQQPIIAAFLPVLAGRRRSRSPVERPSSTHGFSQQGRLVQARRDVGSHTAPRGSKGRGSSAPEDSSGKASIGRASGSHAGNVRSVTFGAEEGDMAESLTEVSGGNTESQKCVCSWIKHSSG